MAIPEKPLEMNISIGALTLEEAAVFDPEDAASNPMGWCNRVRKLLLAHAASWTPAEINSLTLDEIGEVAKQMGAAISQAVTPLASSPSSKPGRGSRRTRSRPGRSTTPTPGSSAVIPKTSPRP